MQAEAAAEAGDATLRALLDTLADVEEDAAKYERKLRLVRESKGK